MHGALAIKENDDAPVSQLLQQALFRVQSTEIHSRSPPGRQEVPSATV